MSRFQNRPPISEQAKGKWAAILPAIGIDKAFLTGRHGPCPMCGGSDRFRWDNRDGRGSFICSQCGSGSGIDLAMKANNWDFKTAAREIEKHVGAAPAIAIPQGPKPEVVKAEMNDIWRGSRALIEADHAALYWTKRVGQIPLCADLRAVASLFCAGQGMHPGMVARIRDTEGRWVNLHRTFLTPEGLKADFPEPRRVMPLPMPKGSAVRLTKREEVSDTLGIAEGIETAVSAAILTGTPCWAALNANNLTGFVPPEGVTRLVIFGDMDASFTGQAATFELARKSWAAREKTGLKSVEVRINGLAFDSTQIDRDWNDVLREKMAQDARRGLGERHAAE